MLRTELTLKIKIIDVSNLHPNFGEDHALFLKERALARSLCLGARFD